MVVNSYTKEIVARSNKGIIRIRVWRNGRIILKECGLRGKNRVKLKRTEWIRRHTKLIFRSDPCACDKVFAFGC